MILLKRQVVKDGRELFLEVFNYLLDCHTVAFLVLQALDVATDYLHIVTHCI